MFYEGNNPIGESGLIHLSKAGWMGLFEINLNFSLKGVFINRFRARDIQCPANT
jgi:hypothetical protein